MYCVFDCIMNFFLISRIYPSKMSNIFINTLYIMKYIHYIYYKLKFINK